MNTMVLFTLRGALAKELFQKLIENGIRHCPMKGIDIRGLFPYKPLTESTHIRSYQTTRTDFVGKLFEKTYINMHTHIGLFGMRVLKTLEHIMHNFK